MTLADKLQRVLNTKGEIKQAIEDKGVPVGNAPFDEYPDKIRQIQTGGTTECVDGWRRPCCWAPFPEQDENSEYFMGLAAIEDTNNEVVSLKWIAGTKEIGTENVINHNSITSYGESVTSKWGYNLGNHVAKNSTSLFTNSATKVLEYDLNTGDFIRELYTGNLGDYNTAFAADDEILVIGLREETTNWYYSSPGIVVVIDLATGNQTTITNPNYANSPDWDNFGAAVAITPDYIFASAIHEDIGSSSTGVVYMFSRTDYSLIHTFQNPEASPNNHQFGTSVAADGNVLVISSIAAPGGKVYVYDLQNYTDIPMSLENPNNSASFAYAISVHGNTIAAGSGNLSSDPGAVHVYNALTGDRLYTLYAPDVYAGFGTAVTITDTYIAVAAPKVTVDGDEYAGKVYIYDRNETELGQFALPPELDRYDAFFGSGGIVIHNNYAYVGTPNMADTRTGITSDAGAVYKYNLTTMALDVSIMSPSDRRIELGTANYMSTFDVQVTSIIDTNDVEITDYTIVDGTIIIPGNIAGTDTITVFTQGYDSYTASYSLSYGPTSTLWIQTDDQIDQVMVLYRNNEGALSEIIDYTQIGSRIILGESVPQLQWDDAFIVTCSVKSVTFTNAPVTIDWGDGTIETYPQLSNKTLTYTSTIYPDSNVWGQTTLNLPELLQYSSVPFAYTYAALEYLGITVDQIEFAEVGIVEFTQTGDTITLVDPVPNELGHIILTVSISDFRITEIESGNTTGKLFYYINNGTLPLVIRDGTVLPDTEWSINGTTITLNEAHPWSSTTVVYSSVSGEATHVYDFSNPALISNLTGQCTSYKQAIVKLTPEPSGNLFEIDVSRPSDNSNYPGTSPWLDIEINGQHVEYVTFFDLGGNGGYLPY